MTQKKSLYTLVLLGLLSSKLTAAEGEVLIDRVLAVVDARPIFYSDIKRKVETGPLIVVSEFPATSESTTQVRALNDAVNFELILSAAKDLDIEVADGDLDQEINRHMEEQKLTKDKLIELLKAEGETYDSYRRDFRNQLTLRRFQRRVIVPAIKVTDKDIETYYLTQAGSGATDMVEVALRQIVIKIDPSQSKEVQEARRSLAQEIHTKLKGGLDFSEAAGLYSDDPSSRSSSAVMTIKVKDLASNIRGLVEPLKPGEFTAPISTPGAIMFFQVAERKLAVNTDFEARRPQLEQEIKINELKSQTNRWLSERRQKVTIKMVED